VAEVTPDGQVIAEWFGRQGATFNRRYRWSTGKPAVPVDLSGWIARMHLRTKVDDAVILLALTTENGGIALEVSGAGWIDIVISATQTKLLPKKAVFDLELESATGFVRNLVGGTLELGSNATREV
jgi:hypothetical protein